MSSRADNYKPKFGLCLSGRIFTESHHPEHGDVSYCSQFAGVLEPICRRQVRRDGRYGTWKPVSPFLGSDSEAQEGRTGGNCSRDVLGAFEDANGRCWGFTEAIRANLQPSMSR
jgi:hypothetical protein